MKFINYILFVGVFSAFGFAAIVYTLWHNGDANTQKDIETDVRVFQHALTDQSSALKKWLRQSQIETTGTEVIHKFVKWGLEHQEDFLNIISSSTEPDKKAPMTEKIAHAIYQGGAEFATSFKAAYKDFDSKELTEIISLIDMLEKEQGNTSNTKPLHK